VPGYFNFHIKDVDMMFTCQWCGEEFFAERHSKICPACSEKSDKKRGGGGGGNAPPWGFNSGFG